MHGMPERASVIGGRLTVWSEPNIGTEVALRVSARACGYREVDSLSDQGLSRDRWFPAVCADDSFAEQRPLHLTATQKCSTHK